MQKDMGVGYVCSHINYREIISMQKSDGQILKPVIHLFMHEQINIIYTYIVNIGEGGYSP